MLTLWFSNTNDFLQHRESEREEGRERQTDRQTDIQTETDRQTDRDGRGGGGDFNMLSTARDLRKRG